VTDEPPIDLAGAKRARHPDKYWCVGFSDRPALYFWDEEEISEEEYRRARPDHPC
jgi:hypothetical protein